MPSKSGLWLAKNYRLLMVLVLLIAAALRLYGLNNLSPPGLEHDEVAHWLINQDILNGEHGLYFAGAYGHEAGYHYLQSGFMLLLGDNVLALRLPSAYLGLLLVAVSFALARRMFDLRTAVLSSALLAVLFWPVFYSRLALRAISLPLMTGLSAYFWWQGWLKWGRDGGLTELQEREGDENELGGQGEGASSRRKFRIPGAGYFLLAGLIAGLSFYTYLASRVVPIFFILFSIYLFAVHRSSLRLRWRGVAIFFLTYALVAAPLAIYLLANPGVEYRLSEINRPLLSLMDGDVLPALGNAFRVLGMFGFQGDPLWRQNVANLPVFEPIVAAFFYIGLLITLFRWRKPPYVFIMLWLLTAVIPSVVSIDAPSSIRIINILPVLTIFPVIGLEVINFLRGFSTVFTKLSPKNVKNVSIIGLVFLFGLNIVRSSWATFQEWPFEEEVRFVWQAALTDAAGYLDESESSAPVAVGGWTPESMDPPTMELTLGREDLSLRHFDPTQSLIIPLGDNAAQEARILAPAALPLDPLLEEQLRTWGAPAQDLGNITLYVVPGDEALLPQNGSSISFADEITFLGYDQPAPCLRSITDDSSSPIECQFITYWRVDRPGDGPRRVFLHALNDENIIVSQDDGLGAPAEHWQPGDLILQRHTLELLPSAGDLAFRLGIYNPETGVRLLSSDGQEFVILSLDS